jgi:hypothetical protein
MGNSILRRTLDLQLDRFSVSEHSLNHQTVHALAGFGTRFAQAAVPTINTAKRFSLLIDGEE